MNIEELRTEKELAKQIAYSANRDFDALRRSRIEQATKIIDEELAPQKKEVGLLQQKSNDAEKAVQDKLIELAKERNQSGYELGSKLQKTQRKFAGFGYNNTSVIIYGILEVVTRETRFPDNTPSYSRPSPGSLIVRLCTKDGKPGKKFVKWTEYESKLWKPVEEQ